MPSKPRRFSDIDLLPGNSDHKLTSQQKCHTKYTSNLEYCPHDHTFLHPRANQEIGLGHILIPIPLDTNQLALSRVTLYQVCLSPSFNQQPVRNQFLSKCWQTYITRNKGIQCESTTLPFIIGMQHDQSIFDSHHDGQGPDDEGRGTEHIFLARVVAEGRREDV
jgi:hypothetical protein